MRFVYASSGWHYTGWPPLGSTCLETQNVGKACRIARLLSPRLKFLHKPFKPVAYAQPSLIQGILLNFRVAVHLFNWYQRQLLLKRPRVVALHVGA